jgi:hypothetical protein
MTAGTLAIASPFHSSESLKVGCFLMNCSTGCISYPILDKIACFIVPTSAAKALPSSVGIAFRVRNGNSVPFGVPGIFHGAMKSAREGRRGDEELEGVVNTVGEMNLGGMIL